jgi:histidinol phosphatase-like PHP family hydrolase
VALGYEALAITDHVDASNIDIVIPAMIRFARAQAPLYPITFVVGVELTHLPPVMIAPMARRARELGAQLVVVHGETIVEPVANGTNFAAAECPDVDILAHSGLVEHRAVEAAAENNVYLELSGRGGHCLGNGRIAARALEMGAKLLVNSDAHSPSDMFGQAHASSVAAGAGLNEEQVQEALITNPWDLVQRCLERYPLPAE